MLKCSNWTGLIEVGYTPDMTTKDDPIFSKVIDELAPAVLNFNDAKLQEFLRQQRSEKIRIFLESWDWQDMPIRKRLLEDELARRRRGRVARAAAGGGLDKGAVQSGGLDKGAVQAAAAATPIGGVAEDADIDAPYKPLSELEQLSAWGARLTAAAYDEEIAGVEPLAEGRTGSPRREESVGRTIITRRQEILEAGPGVKATIDEVLAYYEKNPPNDPDTQQLVKQLEMLSTGLDTYLAMLQTPPSEAKAERAGKSLFKKALSAIKAFEKTYTGEKVVRVTACVAILGAAGLAAPMVSPYLTIPLMGAYVFPEETKVATGLFKVLKGLGETLSILPSKPDDQQKS